jgi:hypothetical protein
MPDSDPPIVVSGGSITIDFDSKVFPPNGNGKHGNPNKKIRRVEVTGDNINFAQDTPSGKVTISIYYENGNG